MESILDVDNFLKSANCDLRVALRNYMGVIAQIRESGNNEELEKKRKDLEELAVRIGLNEKKYFNEMRKYPNIYPRIEIRRRVMNAENSVQAADKECTGSDTPESPLEANGIGISKDVLEVTIKDEKPLVDNSPCKDVLSSQKETNTMEHEPDAHPSGKMNQEEFLKNVSLIPFASVSHYRKKRAERKKRSTEDSQFIYESCVGKDGKSDIDEEQTQAVTPPKCKKRGRPPKIKPLPSIGQELQSNTNEEASLLLADNNVAKSIPKKKRGRPRIRPLKSDSKKGVLVPPRSSEGTEEISSESSSNNSTGHNLKETQANDMLEPAGISQCDVLPVQSNILPKCVIGFLTKIPGTSTDIVGSQNDLVNTINCSDTKVVPFIMYRKLPEAMDIPLAGSPPVSGPSSQSSTGTKRTIAKCKSCLNNFPVLVEETSEFKCLKCRDVQASGSDQNAP